MSLNPLRVLIIADDPLVRAGLSTLLVEQPNLTVVGRAAVGPDLSTELDAYNPDVLLFDLGWEPTRSDSLNHLAELRESGLPVVALLPDDGYAAAAWSAGARGLLLRNAAVERLLAGLQAVAADLVILDPALTAAASPVQPADSAAPLEPLTPRELEVLQLLAEGLPNKAIARRLDISDHTVKFHVNAILGKLGAQSRTEAVVRATRLGLILL
jgi:DNA-binding NarL/FixJ family response regulator